MNAHRTSYNQLYETSHQSPAPTPRKLTRMDYIGGILILVAAALIAILIVVQLWRLLEDDPIAFLTGLSIGIAVAVISDRLRSSRPR